MKLRVVLVTVLFCGVAISLPVRHLFQVWNMAETNSEKTFLYLGWTNGLWAKGPSDIKDVPMRQAMESLFQCLEGLDTSQAVAMLDTYYRNHPEKWKRPLHEQMLQALTVVGGPCEGKNPWP